MTNKLSNFEKEQILLGERPQLSTESFPERAAWEADDTAFRQKFPTEAFVQALETRQRTAKKSNLIQASFVWAPALLAAAVLAVTILPTEVQPSWPMDRTKGTVAEDLHIYRFLNSTPIETLKKNDVVRRGDLLQLSYRVPQSTFGAIISIDGRGTVTPHLVKNGQAVWLEAGKEVFLPTAYELDDAPGFESFLFLTSDQPFSVSTLKVKLYSDPEELARDLQVPGQVKTHILTLRKGQ